MAAQGAAPSSLPKQTDVDKAPVQDDKVDQDGFIAQPTASRHPGKGPFLVGISDVGTQRHITRADFASVGIDQETLVFDWLEGFKIPLSRINPDAVTFLTENEYGFSVSDE